MGTLVTTVDGEHLGRFMAQGTNTANGMAVASCQINFEQDGAAGATYVPGRFTFATSTSTVGPTEHMRIDSSGSVLIGTTINTEQNKMYVLTDDCNIAKFEDTDIPGYWRMTTDVLGGDICLIGKSEAGTGEINAISVQNDDIIIGNNSDNIFIGSDTTTGQIKHNKITDFEDNNAYFSIHTNTGITPALDFTNSNKQIITLTGNTTFSVSTAPAGPCNIVIIINQAVSANYTVTFPATFKWPDGTTYVATATNGATDVINILFDGANYLCADVKAFS